MGGARRQLVVKRPVSGQWVPAVSGTCDSDWSGGRRVNARAVFKGSVPLALCVWEHCPPPPRPSAQPSTGGGGVHYLWVLQPWYAAPRLGMDWRAGGPAALPLNAELNV